MRAGGMSYLLKANAVSRSQVIAAIYETMIRPQLSDRFLQPDPAGPEESPGGGSGADLGVRGDVAMTLRIDPGLQSHFTRATAILERQWEKDGRPLPEQFSPRGGGLWLLLRPDGHVAVASREAAARFGSRPALGDLGLLPEARERLLNKAARLTPGRSAGVSPAVLQTGDPERRYLCRCIAIGRGAQARYWLMLEALDFRWDRQASALLAATFGLHRQQMGLVRGLMWGETLSGLSRSTGIPDARLREQMKQIIAKSGAPGQAEMLRLFAYLIAEAQQDLAIRRGEAPARSCMLREKGLPELEYLRFGSETGQPVIYLHGLMEGYTGAQWLHPQFRQRGFRVYAPLRAGYAGSQALQHPEEAFDVLTDQVEALIRRERLQRVVLLGHRNGGAFAHVIARRLRGRVAGAVIAGGVAPALPQICRFPLPGKVALFRMLARRLPFLLPALIAGRIRGYLLKGPSLRMETRLLEGCRDAELLAEESLPGLFLQSRQRMLTPGVSGLYADFYWLMRDWSRFIGGNCAPVIYLQGDEDPASPPAHLMSAMEGRRNVQIRQCRGTGTLLLFARPELVFAALEELSDR